MEKWEVYWTDCFFMPQDLAEIQVEQPQKEDNPQEYTEPVSYTHLTLPTSVAEYMSSLDIYVSLKPEAIKILRLCVFLIVWGCSTWISTRSCGMKKQSVQYTSHFSIHSMQAMAIYSRNGFSCLNCGISRVLESWPFKCALSMHLCMVAL